MENNLDKFLREQLSLNEISEPNSELVAEARKKISLRKPKAEERPGFFSTLSGFFNLQIKLYQAALATLIIVGYIYFFTKKDVPTQTVVTQYVTERAPVNTSTVLASILTFIARQ